MVHPFTSPGNLRARSGNLPHVMQVPANLGIDGRTGSILPYKRVFGLLTCYVDGVVVLAESFLAGTRFDAFFNPELRKSADYQQQKQIYRESRGINSLHADRGHANYAMQVCADPVHEATRQILRGIDEVWSRADRERSNLGRHHVQLILKRDTCSLYRDLNDAHTAVGGGMDASYLRFSLKRCNGTPFVIEAEVDGPGEAGRIMNKKLSVSSWYRHKCFDLTPLDELISLAGVSYIHSKSTNTFQL